MYLNTLLISKGRMPFLRILEGLEMNEYEENVYNEIKNELVQSVIDKKVDTYFVNKNELNHYYNIGKMIVNAQGRESRAKYGDSLIKKISERLTKENINGYSTRILNLMRKYYMFQKVHAVHAQCVPCMVHN